MLGIIVNVILAATVAVLFFLSVRSFIKNFGKGCKSCGSSGCGSCAGSESCLTNIEESERLLKDPRQ